MPTPIRISPGSGTVVRRQGFVCISPGSARSGPDGSGIARLCYGVMVRIRTGWAQDARVNSPARPDPSALLFLPVSSHQSML